MNQARIILAVTDSSEERLVHEASIAASASHAIISTQGRASTEAAQSVLRSGGNIMDAAIAASFALGVERPHSTGIGGGGFLLYRESSTGRVYAFDFRERAPLRATRDMFLNAQGDVIRGASDEGIRSVATPGFIRGMIELHRKWASLPLSQLVEPAARMAEEGVEVYPDLAGAMLDAREKLARFPETRKIFLHSDGKPYRIGEILVQKDLAKTLRSLAKAEFDGASLRNLEAKIVKESQRLGGTLTPLDFKRYKTRWLRPVASTYKGYEILSMPPPSSGGAMLIETLNILEGLDLAQQADFQSFLSIHLIASALQLSFADRSQYMGDPSFVKVPTERLTSKKYAERQKQRIDLNKHTPSEQLNPGQSQWADESTSTTHFSIMDSEGNVVSSTQTINGHFGSGVTVPATGLLLNDEMDDFSVKRNVGNIYGATGGTANEIAPGKTPLSSMAPTIVLKDNKPVLALGAPGGTRIISCVAEAILNYLEYHLPLFESVAAIRYHHQWKPDELLIDAPGPDRSTLEHLKEMGYQPQISPNGVSCRVMATAHEGQKLHGVSDPRDHGSSLGF